MNRDKLIEFAEKAFYDPTKVPAFQNDFWTITTDELNAFANAIIEECAKVAEALRVTRCEYLSRVEDDIRELKESK